ncbi:alpha/beta fold hydrolase [Candidatus Roizmanbacteria bacterium]|nr:alpha/beta fold hydrolase [Candidatus Roizmanbacteria bacterium]
MSINSRKQTNQKITQPFTDNPNLQGDEGGAEEDLFPLSIEALRKGEYPGSEITIEQALGLGSNYNRYIASYKSEGLKIYALLTVPTGERPPGGWPVIVFNHGYIPPAQYQTTERYVAYVDGFARNGYIVFKPDYRGHGNSEGEPAGAYGSNAYTIDVLNAVASIKKLSEPSQTDNRLLITDSNRIGMWGHSLGGFVTLRSMVVNKDIKAGVIWAGVVASYPDLVNRWRRGSPRPTFPGNRGSWRQSLTEKYGSPEENPAFWNSISANYYLKDISGPLQLHHGTADSSVPIEFSQTLEKQMKEAGKTVELYTYSGDDHNISASFNLAMQRSVEFFDRYLKVK